MSYFAKVMVIAKEERGSAWDKSFYKDLIGKRKKQIDEALEKVADEKLTKAVTSGKWNMSKAADYLEDINYHSVAALFRNDKNGDADSLMHAEDSHNRIDLDTGEKYPGERDGMLALKYEAGGNNADGWDEKKIDTDIWGNDIKNRKLRAMIYMEHHKLEDKPTYKKMLDHVNNHKDKYKVFLKNLVTEYMGHAKKLSEDKSDPRNKKVATYYRKEAQIAKAFGKKHGLV